VRGYILHFGTSTEIGMEQHHPHQDRYVPAHTNDGWGAAAATVLLALVLIASATVIHKRTWKQPTDPTYRAIGEQSKH
jgi:hypothetical protein